MDNANRRHFLKALGVCLVATNIPRPLTALAVARGTQPVSLDPAQWRCAAAICAEIIPTDDTAGATEAGCINFIDKALAAEDAVTLPLYQAALGAVDGLCVSRHGRAFAELAAPVRHEFLTQMEQGRVAGWTVAFARAQDFFATIRFHTLLAFVVDPKNGGNKDYAGWKLMGFPGPLHQVGGTTPGQMMGVDPVTPIWKAAGDHNQHGLPPGRNRDLTQGSAASIDGARRKAASARKH